MNRWPEGFGTRSGNGLLTRRGAKVPFTELWNRTRASICPSLLNKPLSARENYFMKMIRSIAAALTLLCSAGTCLAGTSFATVTEEGELKFARVEIDGKKASWSIDDRTIAESWPEFSKVFSDDCGNVYAVHSETSELLFYKYAGAAEGTADWSIEGKVIGEDFDQYIHLAATGCGNIYACDKKGVFYQFRFAGTETGERKWAFEKKKVGSGWHKYKHVVADASGNFYCVKSSGSVEFNRHVAAETGDAKWAFRRNVTIGSGFSKYVNFAADGKGAVYAIDSKGVGYYYHYAGADKGTRGWSIEKVKLPDDFDLTSAFALKHAAVQGSPGQTPGTTPGQPLKVADASGNVRFRVTYRVDGLKEKFLQNNNTYTGTQKNVFKKIVVELEGKDKDGNGELWHFPEKSSASEITKMIFHLEMGYVSRGKDQTYGGSFNACNRIAHGLGDPHLPPGISSGSFRFKIPTSSTIKLKDFFVEVDCKNEKGNRRDFWALTFYPHDTKGFGVNKFRQDYFSTGMVQVVNFDKDVELTVEGQGR